VHVVCVVNREEGLIGVLDLRTVADDLFGHIMPEEFLSEVTDLDHVLQFTEEVGCALWSTERVRARADGFPN
jgi:hypothetical protein